MKKIFLCNLIFTFFVSVGFAQTYQIGHKQQTFVDASRANRNISTEIYYPANDAGENVSIAKGQFPVLVFGHGFVMTWSAYDVVWEALVPEAYIMVFPTTETSFSPSHIDLAKDMAFLVSAMKAENENATSTFYEAVAPTSALMGHSMGGGCAFLGIDYNPEITAIATLAAANTNPSAIQSATGISIPAIIFSGGNDCITPPAEHQIPMYDSLASVCKSFVSITGGSHCQFASYNFYCSVGELSCAPNAEITAEEQQSTTSQLLLPWLDFYLKNDCDAGTTFQTLITAGEGITSMQNCTLTCTGNSEIPINQGLNCSPNPFRSETIIQSDCYLVDATLSMYNAKGQLVKQMKHINSQNIRLLRDDLPKGIYSIQIAQAKNIFATKRLVIAD
jgi:pimeloyl-ACP methyl ester carboxylesterase